MPRPVLPSTPTEWASSIISQAPYFLQSSTTLGRSITSPSMLKTASAITSIARPDGNVLQAALQVLHIIVAKATKFCAGHHAAIHNRGMVQLVREHVIAAPHQRRDRRPDWWHNRRSK